MTFTNANGNVQCSVFQSPDVNDLSTCFKPVEDDFSLRASAGISINWRSPFGPVQIDIAEAFLAEEYDEKQTFRFSAGGAF